MSEETGLPLSHPENPPTIVKRRLSWRLRLFLLTLGLGLGTMVAEISLRILPVSFRPAVGYLYDSHCGSRLMPSQSGWQRKEGEVYVSTNSHGYRNREHSLSKPEGTYRIAILGDSYAEAVQVELEETFWSVMADDLGHCLPEGIQHIEVLNFGVSGYGTGQELQMLRHYAWQYEPDMVVLAFLSGNDLRNNSRDLEPARQRPFFFLEEGQLTLDNAFRTDPATLRYRNSSWLQSKDWLIRHFELCALICDLRHRTEKQQSQSAEQLIERGLSGTIYAPPTEKVWQDTWLVTEKLIEQMHLEVTETGVPFVVLSVTSAIVVNPESGPREELCEQLEVEDLFYPDRWVERISKENGFPVVLLSEAMQEHAVKQQIYFHGFQNAHLGGGHWNVEGHKFAGEQLSRVICEQNLMQPAKAQTDP